MPFTPPHRRVAGADRDRVVPLARADRRRLPQLRLARVAVAREFLLLDKANLLTLTAPEMTVLGRGSARSARTLGRQRLGRLHRHPRCTDERRVREPPRPRHDVEAARQRQARFEGTKDGSGEKVGIGTRVDLLFSSNSSCARSPRSTPPTTRRRSSSATSSPRGARSPSSTASTWSEFGSLRLGTRGIRKVRPLMGAGLRMQDLVPLVVVERERTAAFWDMHRHKWDEGSAREVLRSLFPVVVSAGLRGPPFRDMHCDKWTRGRRARCLRSLVPGVSAGRCEGAGHRGTHRTRGGADPRTQASDRRRAPRQRQPRAPSAGRDGSRSGRTSGRSRAARRGNGSSAARPPGAHGPHALDQRPRRLRQTGRHAEARRGHARGAADPGEQVAHRSRFAVRQHVGPPADLLDAVQGGDDPGCRVVDERGVDERRTAVEQGRVPRRARATTRSMSWCRPGPTRCAADGDEGGVAAARERASTSASALVRAYSPRAASGSAGSAPTPARA